MLLSAQAHALAAAAGALYAAIGDREPMLCDLLPSPLIPAEVVAGTGTPGYRAGASASSPLDALLQKLIPRLAAVTDSIAGAAAQYSFCCALPPRSDLNALAGVLVAIAQETKALATMLPDNQDAARLKPVLAGIRALEMRGDRVFCQTMARLQADDQSNPRSLAQWRCVYEAVTQAIRRCGQIAVFVGDTPQFLWR